MRTDDLQGAIWIPGDGKANPADLCMSLAKGARNRGVRMVEGVEVVGVLVDDGPVGGASAGAAARAGAAGPRAVGVRVRQGEEIVEIRCETLVNCAGQWARQFGALAGVTVPLYPAEHFYIVTDKIEGVHPMLPVMRDPDGFIYYKEEVGGLLMGGFEPQAKPWTVDPIPSTFQFQLLDEDWDQFEILMTNAIHRTPCLETAKIKMLLNGPESFTPDGNFILGEAPELRNYFVCAGFNSAGIANSGGAGQLIAQWIAAGEPPGDLWDVDIRRFGPHNANRKGLAERTGETLGLHYAMRWPRQELQTTRPLRTSPLYDLLAGAVRAPGAAAAQPANPTAQGAALAEHRVAEFGSKNGWERANYFRPAGASRPADTLGRPGWLDWVIEEQRATREAVAIYDQSSFGKLLLQGRDALAVLQRLCANDIDPDVASAAPGNSARADAGAAFTARLAAGQGAATRMVYTAMLNERGGFESDLTVMRLPTDALGERFLLITGSAQPVRDADWIRRHINADEHAVLTDVTPMWSVLSVMGPKARELLARVSPDDLSPEGLKFSHTKEIDLGHARVRAARMAYVGGPGYELYVPVEMTRHVYLALMHAGADLGVRDAGYYALDALRIEAGRRAWGAELGPDETPFEAGLTFAVKLDKPGFIGREALLAARGQPLRKKLVTFVFDDPAVYAWGGESIVIDGQPVGELSSVGWGWAAGRCVGLGYVRGDAAAMVHAGTPVTVDLWGQAVGARAWNRWSAQLL
jgi:4-methylaminobutanoate oxidase (formaldehyde-forming)